ncbi:M23 family metallopeptidase, partial [Microbacterium sp. B24]|uniref:M23 family metallopeptidase n=1 Tax=Microbacterium sp. B24 TaxID=95616 RepID=UPI0005695FD9
PREFEFAARLFSFTGETPVQQPSSVSAEPAQPVAAAEAVVHVAGRRRPRGAAIAKRVAAASFSVGVMAVVGLLAVGTTTPAAAIASASESSNTAAQPTAVTASQKLTKSSDAGQIQAFVASGTDAPTALDRPESYNVTSMSELAAESGVRLFANTWVNDPSSPIQYPFPVGVPISAAFGSIAYMSEFATPHNGVDLTPGEGAEIHAVAAGTVRIATESGGDYGVTVLIDHIIDGQLVSTRYGHMQYGSLQVKVGDKVTAGQVIGRVGQTGKATGPHLHLEVLLGGTTRIDPMPWLAEHTKPGHTVG